MPSTRRDLLALSAGAVATALAGCGGSVVDSDDNAGSTLHFDAVAEDGTLRERHVTDLAETRPPWDESAFRAALDGESDTIQHRPPFPGVTPDDPAYARHDGTYYELGHVVVGEVETSHPVLRLYEANEQSDGDGADSETVDPESLPEADQRAVRIAYFAARARGDQGGVPWSLLTRGGYAYRDSDAVAASDLLAPDGPEFVAYRDDRWRVDHRTETFHEAVYRPDVEPVTDDPAELERILRARLLDARVDPDALSTAQRDIVRQARGDGYSATYPYPDSLSDLLRHLDERAYLDGDVSNDAGTDVPDGYRVLLYGDTYLRYRIHLASDS